MKRFIFLLLISGFGLVQALCAGEKVHTAVSFTVEPSTTIAFGQDITIHFSIESNQELAISSVPQTDSAAWQELRNHWTPFQESNGKFLAFWDLTLRPFELGNVTVPPQTLAEVTGSTVITTPAVTVTVRTNFKEKISAKDFLDIEGPIAVRRPIGKIILWSLFGILLCAAAIYWWKQHRKQKAALLEEIKNRRPADEIALEKLESVYQTYVADGQVRLYFFGLSELLREYIGRAFHVDAMEKTTSEIFRDLRDTPLARNERLKIRELLSDCDLVKFAKYIPAPESIQKSYEETRALILRIRPNQAGANEQKELPGASQ